MDLKYHFILYIILGILFSTLLYIDLGILHVTYSTYFDIYLNVYYVLVW